ncbi:MAG: asparaginase [Rhizobiaceae bacterium]|nr:asparaginase [Rhizobiaceae bacterium]
MSNPVLVEVTRGSVVESRHRGAISVMDADGNSVLNIGDTARPVFARSAIKAVQALPLIESGAANAYGFGDAELALACSSHSGEDAHIEMARSMLASAGRTEDDLECGGHWSSHEEVLIHQAKIRTTEPGALCNNCSGKHSGFICTATHLGIDPKGYINPDHQVMKTVKGALEDVTGVAHAEDLRGRDGCSIPTYATPLTAMAHGFAKMATGQGLGVERAKAGRRLLNACMSAPFYMSGTNRFCSQLIKLDPGRLFGKTGAEGVFCGTIEELGVGIALKCDDGTTRASEAMMAAVVAHLLTASDPLHEKLRAMANPSVTNRNGFEVGSLRTNLPK